MSPDSFKIWFGSLSHYTDGILCGEWVSLPQDYDKLREIYNKYTNDGQNDYFIPDWEAPFKISEYEDIFKLSDITEDWESRGDDEHIKILYLMEDEGQTYWEATEKMDDIVIHSAMTFKELAENMVDDGVFGHIPDHLASYIDYEAIGRDLSCEGRYTEKGSYIIENCAC